MELTVRPEPHLDFEATARMANEAFGAIGRPFTAERLEWLYRRSFSNGTLVLGLYAGGEKVGQVALLGQAISLDGRVEPAVALVDLFIAKDHRGKKAIAALYGHTEAVCRERGIRFILAVPNGKAIGVNEHFLKLRAATSLEIRAGVGVPLRSRRVLVSAMLERFDRAGALQLFEPFTPQLGIGLEWTAESLWERLQDPAARYSVHATRDLLMIASATTRRRVPMVLISGLFARPGAVVDRVATRALANAACALHRRPLFVYIGRNAVVAPPGWPVPSRLRPSLMIVQARDLDDDDHPLLLDRFELLDFDFA